MIWTTAGTNRVCSRCLALKDTVVGYTDELGVLLPPLHPRCRCAIMYDEVGTPRAMQPKPKPSSVSYAEATKYRTAEEFVMLANQFIPNIEKYTGKTSKWNGKILVKDEGNAIGGKPWNCAIRLNPDAPEHALIHELVHSCSVSHYGLILYFANQFEEELTVEYLSQELTRLEGFPVFPSDYGTGVELIRELKKMLNEKISDLEFASELIKKPLGERWDWLWEQISVKMTSETPLELGRKMMDKLEQIRQWVTETSKQIK